MKTLGGLIARRYWVGDHNIKKNYFDLHEYTEPRTVFMIDSDLPFLSLSEINVWTLQHLLMPPGFSHVYACACACARACARALLPESSASSTLSPES